MTIMQIRSLIKGRGEEGEGGNASCNNTATNSLPTGRFTTLEDIVHLYLVIVAYTRLLIIKRGDRGEEPSSDSLDLAARDWGGLLSSLLLLLGEEEGRGELLLLPSLLLIVERWAIIYKSKYMQTY